MDGTSIRDRAARNALACGTSGGRVGPAAPRRRRAQPPGPAGRGQAGDIADEAGLAHGSFYSHFRNKEDALAAVLAEVGEEMLPPGPSLAESGPAHTGAGPDPVAVIHAANVAYLEAYRRNARLMALMEQVATVDERFAALRLERSEAFLARNARAIRRLQRAGLADPALDPDLASLALSTMVSRSAYAAFAMSRPPVSVKRLAATLTRLWANALGLSA